MFVRVRGFKDRQDTKELTSLWQTELYNNHAQAERFMIEYGSHAWEAKDFLVE